MYVLHVSAFFQLHVHVVSKHCYSKNIKFGWFHLELACKYEFIYKNKFKQFINEELGTFDNF